jgi:hypothetical protein
MTVRPFTQGVLDEVDIQVIPRSIPGGISAFAPVSWEDPFELENNWPTEVLEGQVFGSYQSNSLQDRPTRTVRGKHIAMGDSALAIMYQEQMALQTQAHTALPADNKYKIESGYDSVFQYPLFCDESVISGVSGLTITATGVSVRRFYVGQRVFLTPPCGGGDFEISGPYGVNHSTAVIAGISGDDILLSGASSVTPQVGWKVIPSLDCMSLEEIPERVISANCVTMDIQAQERAGPSAIPACKSATLGPLAGWSIGPESRYILNVAHNFAYVPSAGFVRSGTRVATGMAGFVNQVGFAARRVWGLAATLSREQFWLFLQFWDWHRGPAKSFWFPFPKLVWGEGVQTLSTTSISAFRRGTNVLFERNVDALALYNSQDELRICRISGITETPGGTWQVDLADPLPSGFVVDIVRPAAVVSFSGNTMSESWMTPEWMNLSVSIVQNRSDEVTEFLVP